MAGSQRQFFLWLSLNKFEASRKPSGWFVPEKFSKVATGHLGVTVLEWHKHGGFGLKLECR